MMSMSKKTVQIWIEQSDNHSDMVQLESLLDNQERMRAKKFYYERDRKDFVIAHALKRKRIAEKLSIQNPSSLKFASGPYGKPYLPDEDIHFNLSHSNGVSALILSTNGPCSIDIEVHRKIRQLPMLVQKTMTNTEQNKIQAAPSQLNAFFDRWVLKEAFLKLSGIGLNVPLKTICTASEVKKLRENCGVLRGAELYFRNNQYFSLAACSYMAVDFVIDPKSNLSLM